MGNESQGGLDGVHTSSSSSNAGIKTGQEGKVEEKNFITVKTLMFARARELTGVSEFDLRVPEGASTLSCLEELLEKFPSLESIVSCMTLALNCNYVSEPIPVKNGDELAIIPPISGG